MGILGELFSLANREFAFGTNAIAFYLRRCTLEDEDPSIAR